MLLSIPETGWISVIDFLGFPDLCKLREVSKTLRDKIDYDIFFLYKRFEGKQDTELSDYLNQQEVEELFRLFEDIKLDLSDKSFPTRTNRLEAVSNMKRVLEIHGYDVLEQKTAEELSSNKHQGREDY